MNPIIEMLIEARNGHYCHAIEVNDVFELESLTEAIYSEFEREFEREQIIEFLQTAELYCIDESQEDEVFKFNFEEAINNY